jgi:F0F1-type ATP synthase assembly protein I
MNHKWGRGWKIASQSIGNILGPLIVGWLAGQWLDRQLGLSKPWLTVVLLILGVLTGIYGMVKMVNQSENE